MATTGYNTQVQIGKLPTDSHVKRDTVRCKGYVSDVENFGNYGDVNPKQSITVKLVFDGLAVFPLSEYFEVDIPVLACKKANTKYKITNQDIFVPNLGSELKAHTPHWDSYTEGWHMMKDFVMAQYGIPKNILMGTEPELKVEKGFRNWLKRAINYVRRKS